MAAILKNTIFKNVPLIFQRFIGAKFHLNGFYLPNPLRNKGSERMVTKPPNMTLLTFAWRSRRKTRKSVRWRRNCPGWIYQFEYHDLWGTYHTSILRGCWNTCNRGEIWFVASSAYHYRYAVSRGLVKHPEVVHHSSFLENIFATVQPHSVPNGITLISLYDNTPHWHAFLYREYNAYCHWEAVIHFQPFQPDFLCPGGYTFSCHWYIPAQVKLLCTVLWSTRWEPDRTETEQITDELPDHINLLYETIIAQTRLTADVDRRFRDVLRRRATTFVTDSTDIGFCPVLQHDVDTGDSPTIKQSPRRPPISAGNAENDILDDMLLTGVIKPSTSEWAFPVCLLKKTDGSYRFCIDYRRINAVSRKDGFSIPDIQVALDSLRELVSSLH